VQPCSHTIPRHAPKTRCASRTCTMSTRPSSSIIEITNSSRVTSVAFFPGSPVPLLLTAEGAGAGASVDDDVEEEEAEPVRAMVVREGASLGNGPKVTLLWAAYEGWPAAC
jgi:hypothetical protein